MNTSSISSRSLYVHKFCNVPQTIVSLGIILHFCSYKAQENIKHIYFYYGSKGGIAERTSSLHCRFRGGQGSGGQLMVLFTAFQNPLVKEYTLNYNRIPNMN